MANNYFQFKQFTIHQAGSAMKVGTDGVLLGAWVDVEGASNILDVGAGTGLIAIMLAQRTTTGCSIEAVEIEEQAYRQAVRNIQECPWASRLKIYHVPFQEFVRKEKTRYDLLVSNPPFFINSLATPEKSRTQARHTTHMFFEELIAGAKAVLNKNGRLAVVLPVKEGELFIRLAQATGFYLQNQIKVIPNPGKAPKRYLLEFSKRQNDLKEEELVVESGQRHEYSPDYIALTKDFYLKF